MHVTNSAGERLGAFRVWLAVCIFLHLTVFNVETFTVMNESTFSNGEARTRPSTTLTVAVAEPAAQDVVRPATSIAAINIEAESQKQATTLHPLQESEEVEEIRLSDPALRVTTSIPIDVAESRPTVSSAVATLRVSDGIRPTTTSSVIHVDMRASSGYPESALPSRHLLESAEISKRSAMPSAVYQPLRPQYPNMFANQIYPSANSVVILQPGYPATLVPVVIEGNPHVDVDSHRWHNAALCCSISSLVLTCLCCFSIPAIVLAVKSPSSPQAKKNYKISVGVSALAFTLAAVCVITAIVLFTYVLKDDLTTNYRHYKKSSTTTQDNPLNWLGSAAPCSVQWTDECEYAYLNQT